MTDKRDLVDRVAKIIAACEDQQPDPVYMDCAAATITETLEVMIEWAAMQRAWTPDGWPEPDEALHKCYRGTLREIIEAFASAYDLSLKGKP